MEYALNFLGGVIIGAMLIGLGFIIFVGYKLATTPLWKMRENFHRNTRRPC